MGTSGAPWPTPHLSSVISKQSIWANTSSISSFSFCGWQWGRGRSGRESQGVEAGIEGVSQLSSTHSHPSVTPTLLSPDRSPSQISPILKVPNQTASVYSFFHRLLTWGCRPQVPTLLPAFPSLSSAAVESPAALPSPLDQPPVRPAAIFLKQTGACPAPAQTPSMAPTAPSPVRRHRFQPWEGPDPLQLPPICLLCHLSLTWCPLCARYCGCTRH